MQNAKFINADQKTTKTVRNSLNYDYREIKHRSTFSPSRTVPDQSMSVREILERHSRGLPIDGWKTPIYDEDNDLPDIRTLDLAERQELADQYKAELSAIAERKKEKPKEDTGETQEPEPDPTTEPPAPES